MFRRPVVRRAGVGLIGTTMVAGAAYTAGSRGQRRAYQESEQDQRLAELEAEQQAQRNAPPPQSGPPPSAPAPAATAAASPPDRIEQLKQLAELKQAGVLTDQEFEREKQRILST